MPYKDPAKGAAYHAEYRKTHREQLRQNANKYFHENKDKAWERSIRVQFEMTPIEYGLLLASQDGRCKICGITPDAYGRRLAVDHDHITGKVRGLLCCSCNPALGYFRDSIPTLKAATSHTWEGKLATVTFTPHEHQAAVLKDKADYILMIAGKRGGKTACAAIKFISKIAENLKKGVEGDYLILGPTYGLLKNGTLPALFKYWPKKLGVYRRSESRIELPNNHYVFIISADEPDRIEAFGILGAWLDEAGQMRQEAWEKVQQRMTVEAGGGSGFILFSTTPYGVPNSWLNRDLIQRRAEMPWVSYHNWSSLQNPYIDHTAIERMRITMNPQLFTRDVMGVYTSIDGLIYPDFDRKEDAVKPFTIPAHWPIFCGIDYGFTDPTVILILAKDPETSIFYVVDEFYESKKELRDFQTFLETWRGKVKQLLYDPSAVGIMTELQRLTRMNLVAADNDVDTGIARVTRIIKSDRLKAFNTCQNFLREMESYVYAEGKNKPAHDNSHSCDALRYAFSKDLMGIYPELKRGAKNESFNKCFNDKGEFVPPVKTIAEIFDLNKKPKRANKSQKAPEDAFEYKPAYEPFSSDEW